MTRRSRSLVVGMRGANNLFCTTNIDRWRILHKTNMHLEALVAVIRGENNLSCTIGIDRYRVLYETNVHLAKTASGLTRV